MSSLRVEILRINKMESGHLCLDLTDNLTWEDFPIYADLLLMFLGGRVISKADGPDIRLWNVSIDKNNYRLTFDDYPLMVALESSDCEADIGIRRIRDSLLVLQNMKMGSE